MHIVKSKLEFFYLILINLIALLMASINPDRPSEIIYLFFAHQIIFGFFFWIWIFIIYLNSNKSGLNFKAFTLKILTQITILISSILCLSAELFSYFLEPELIFNGVLILLISNLFILYKKNKEQIKKNIISKFINTYFIRTIPSNLFFLILIYLLNSKTPSINANSLQILLIVKAILDVFTFFIPLFLINKDSKNLAYNF